MKKITFELLSNRLAKLLKNGYDKDGIVKFVLEYVKVDRQLQLEMISSFLDRYLLQCLVGAVPENNRFGTLIPITEKDKKDEKYRGVFDYYSEYLRNKIGYMLTSGSLKNILNVDDACRFASLIPEEIKPYLQELFDPNNYEDLCMLYILSDERTFYTNLYAFRQLLESKGLTDEHFKIVLGTYNIGTTHTREVPSLDVYINSYKPSTGEKGIV